MDIFISNKYTSWYYSIIKNAKSQVRIKGNGIYYENHHIIPRCMSGSNEYNNLILLTAREHFICHHLLIKMVEDSKIKHKLIGAFRAFNMRSKNQNRNLTAYQYEILRKQNSIHQSEFRKTQVFSKESLIRRAESMKKAWAKHPTMRDDLIKRNKNRVWKSKKRAVITEASRRYRQHGKDNWKLTKTDGTMICVKNRALWAKENGYNNSRLSCLYKGRISTYKEIIQIEKL